MKTSLTTSIIVLFLFTGCAMNDSISGSAMTRSGVNLGAGASAAAVGYAASDGNPYITAGSALGAMAITQALQGDDSEYGRRMMARGVEVGQTIEAKRLYFALQNASTATPSKQNQQLVYMELTIPPREVNGIKFAGEKVYIPTFDAVTGSAPYGIGNPGMGQMVDGGTDILRDPPADLRTVTAQPTLKPNSHE